MAEAYGLSVEQRRLWRLSRGGGRFESGLEVEIDGALDPRRLRESIRALVRRHGSLRTTFGVPPGLREPRQTIHADLPPDWTAGSPTLDPEDSPVLGVTVEESGAGRRRLTLRTPALNADLRSLVALLAELGELAAAGGAVPDEPVQLVEFSAWQELVRSEVSASPEGKLWRAYWKGCGLDRFARTSLPGARRAAPEGFGPACVAVPLDRAAGRAVRAIADRWGTVPEAVVLAAWHDYLVRLAGTEDVPLAAVLPGSREEELASAVGLFSRAVPLQPWRDADSGSDAARAAARALDRAEEWQELGMPGDLGEGDGDRSVLRFPFLFEPEEIPEHVSVAGASGAPARWWSWTEPFTLKLTTCRRGESLVLGLHHETGRVAPDEALRWATGFAGLLEELAARDDDRPLRELAGREERRSLFVELSGGPSRVSEGPARFVARFEASTREAPDHVAIVAGDRTLSYGAVDRLSGRLARFLRDRRIGADSVVALHLPRSAEAVVAMLGVIRAGAAYLVLEPGHPPARMEAMFEAACPALVLTGPDLEADPPPAPGASKARLSSLAVEELPLSLALENRPARGAAPEPSPAVPEDALAYLSFTSGSTGRPKGVMVTRRNLSAYVESAIDLLDPPHPARWATVSTFAADLGNTVVFPALATGGTLEIVAADALTDPIRFRECMEDRRIDLLKIVPSHLSALADAGDLSRSLPARRLVLGGDAVSSELALRIAEEGGAGLRAFNHYGPTETTVGALAGPLTVPPEGNGAPPLGRPLPGVRARIVGPGMRPTPWGAIGELYLSGPGVARGYAARPGETAERFLPDPSAERPGERCYRTGDLVSVDARGTFRFAGRADHQLKVRGYRVEPGEVAAALRRLPGVRDVVVVARREADLGTKLVAYVVAREADWSPPRLDGPLAELLPPYMIPNEIIPLDALPLSSNGKVDRDRLPWPPPDGGRVLPAEGSAPRTRLELDLALLWEELLGRAVGVRDDFFRAGGHSLLAVRLVAEVQRRFGHRLTLGQLMRSSTLEALAERIGRDGAGAESSHLVSLSLSGGDPGDPPPPSLFCVHPAGGTVMCYLPLARELASTRRVYGVQARGVEDGAAPDRTVEAMAERYVEAIVQAHPEGPYELAGWSFGGLVAFEMARRLALRGAVSRLVLLDAFAPGFLGSREPTPVDDAATVLTFYAREAGLEVSEEELRGRPEEDQVRRVSELAVRAGLLPARGAEDDVARILRVYRASLAARRSYRPEPYDGPVSLVRALEVPRRELELALETDPTAGWQAQCRRSIRVHAVDAGHLDLLTPKRVDRVVEALWPRSPESSRFPDAGHLEEDETHETSTQETTT